MTDSPSPVSAPEGLALDAARLKQVLLSSAYTWRSHRSYVEATELEALASAIPSLLEAHRLLVETTHELIAAQIRFTEAHSRIAALEREIGGFGALVKLHIGDNVKLAAERDMLRFSHERAVKVIEGLPTHRVLDVTGDYTLVERAAVLAALSENADG